MNNRYINLSGVNNYSNSRETYAIKQNGIEAVILTRPDPTQYLLGLEENLSLPAFITEMASWS